MENKYILGIIALAIVAVLGFSIISAFGFGKGFMNHDITDEEKKEMLEQKEGIMTVIEDGDYETWKSLMEAQLTKEDFNKLVEKYSKMSELKEHKKGFAYKGKDFKKWHSGECGK